ncbi:hypothetical protein DPMN_191188 [Dreissena polymorpha]|uniref:Uncharacterized protein n=1 Tax=Dreissena polymorpha TaxID=45954 RepID=A0A9D3Y0X3_DREPO|nr:hypothetical protein DPMN_191188 [Dreissena polymorpha]
MEVETPYRDFLTSEPSLKLLENPIQAFHIKYGMGHKTKNLPPLKRYKLDVRFRSIIKSSSWKMALNAFAKRVASDLSVQSAPDNQGRTFPLLWYFFV